MVAPSIPDTCVTKLSVPEMVASVVDATHAGTPLAIERTKPPVPAARRERVFAPEAYRMSPVAYDVWLVPPRVSASVPVVSEIAIPSDEVANWSHVFPAPPIRSDEEAMVERPVPPRVAVRVPVVPATMGRPVASARLKAGVASEPPSASDTPPKETVELVRPVLSRVPESEGVNVRISPEPTTVNAAVRPLNDDVDEAIVMVDPVCVCPMGPRAVMPDEPPTQVPLIAKHPLVMLNPTFDVEVALPAIFKPESVVVPKPVPEMASAFTPAI